MLKNPEGNIFWRVQTKGVYLLLSHYQASVFIYSWEQARSKVLCKQILLAANAYNFTILYKITEGIKTKPRSDIFCQTGKNRVLAALEQMLEQCKMQRIKTAVQETNSCDTPFELRCNYYFQFKTSVFSLKLKTTLNIKLLFVS